MEKPKEFSISVSNFTEAGSSSTAGSKNMQGESSPSNIGFAQIETLRGCSPKSSTSASSTPSTEIACLNGTSGQSREIPVKFWTHVTFSVFELIVVGCSLAGLIANFIVERIGEFTILESGLWAWCVLVLVTVCGRHFMGWVMMRVKESTERAFEFFQGKFHYSYYIYGLRKSLGVFLWFVLILLTWYLLLDTNELIKRQQTPTEIRNFIRNNLITLVIGGALWVVKTFLVNKLSSSFQVTRYFDWIRNSLINQHILDVFGPDDADGAKASLTTGENLIKKLKRGNEERGKKDQGVIYRLLHIDLILAGQNLIKKLKRGKDGRGNKDQGVIYRLLHIDPKKEETGKKDQGVVSRLVKIDPKRVSAWTMKDLIKSIRDNKLSSITEKELENLVDDEEFWAKLESEDEVPELERAADLIFRKMKSPRAKLEEEDEVPELHTAADPTSSRVITKDDLKSRCSFRGQEAAAVIRQINGQKVAPRDFNYPSKNQTNEVSRQALKTWLVAATVERRTLVQCLNDMNCAIKELNEFVSGIVLILLVVIWSLLVGLLTREGLVLTLSQLFVLTFMFGNTAKIAFEGIIFVFVNHPFVIGDLCLINGEEMVVERINLLTTVFRKNNNDKVFYSNSVLSTLPIRNIYRGNVHTKDSLEFTIKWPKALDKKIIDSLISHIKDRLCEDKNNKWFPECDLVVKELEDENRAKMALYVTCCNVNVHRSRVTMTWLRHELIMALNGILRDLEIEHCEIRPQEVDHMKNTAKQPSTHEPNKETNDCEFEKPGSQSNEETITNEEEENDRS